jgi:hypothetical protein
MQKKSFLNEPRDMIASMRRNNGDAVSNTSKMTTKHPLNGGLPCIRFQRSERTDDVET